MSSKRLFAGRQYAGRQYAPSLFRGVATAAEFIEGVTRGWHAPARDGWYPAPRLGGWEPAKRLGGWR